MSIFESKFSWFLTFSVTVIFYLANWNIKGPTIQADESGYLMNAAALTGFWVDSASSYHAGYSVFLIPAFLFGGEPHTVFMLVKLINSALWGVSALVLYNVLKMIFPTADFRKLVGATVISLLYPAWITISGYAFSESAYVLFFTLSVFFALRVVQDGRHFWVVWAISLGYLFVIHPKSVPVLISAAIAAVLIAKARRDWHQLPSFFLVVVGIVVLYKYSFEPWLISGMTTGSYPPYLHYPSAHQYLSVLVSIDGLKEFAVRLSGHIMYIGLATLGLVLYPFISGLNAFRQALSEKKLFIIYTGNNPVQIYIALSFVGTLLLSALSFTSNGATRLDHWMYGRYVEGVILPLLAIGFLTMGTRRILASFVFTGIFAIVLCAGIDNYTNTAPFNVSGFWQEFFFRDKSPVWWYLVGVLPLLVMVVLHSIYFRFGILICVFVFASYLQIQWHVRANSDSENRQYLAYFIRDHFKPGSCVASDIDQNNNYSSMWFYRQYAFYLYDYDYKKMDVVSWYNNCNGPFISFSRDIHRRFEGVIPIAVERNNGPLLWMRSQENYHEMLSKPVAISPTSIEARLLLGSGWHNIEMSHVWSKAEAELYVPVAHGCQSNECGIRLSFSVFNASKMSPKRVLVEVEGVQVAEWIINSGEVHERIIPLHTDLLGAEARDVQLRIRVPEATSPAALGLSKDSRILGIGLREIELLQGDAFREALRRYNCQPPQCLNWNAERESIPMQVGKSVSGTVRSTGRSGFLVYGPYVHMKPGKYMLELRGKVHSNKGRVVTDVVGDKGRWKFASIEGLDEEKLNGSKELLNRVVILDKAVDDLEVRVWVDELADLELYGYSLRPIND